MKKMFVILMSFALNLPGFPLYSFEMPSLVEKDYFISAGDVVDINVYPADEFSKEVTVQPDGTVELPLLGAIKVSGIRASELEKILTSKFSKYVSEPKVTVSVRKFSTYKVGVIGQVQFAGYYDYYEGMKILDLISSARGFSDYPDTKNIRVFRNVKNEKGETVKSSFEIDLSELFNGNTEKNIQLMPGDIVYIPKKKFSSAGKWITDNLMPWTMLFTFAIVLIRR